jgi:Carboxypeptidase regulatory-like domain/TonB dependent receptor
MVKTSEGFMQNAQANHSSATGHAALWHRLTRFNYRFFIRRLALAPVLAILLAPALIAQIVETGVITGVVHDDSGSVVDKAQVTLENSSTGLVTTTQTEPSGLFVSPPLAPGNYTVEFKAEGFRTTVEHIRLEVGQRVAANPVLRIGKASETVDVIETTPTLLDTETSTVTNLRTEEEVKDLPLNGRNFAELVGLGAGVVPAQTQIQNIPYTQQRGATSYAANGLRYQENRLLLDGIGDNENHNGLGIIIFPPIDAIQEFTEATNDADARYGRTDGATINVLYKSGTNQYHGTAFEFLRNAALDAKNYFDKSKPPFHMNEFGVTFGGPVFRGSSPKTFFFADYSGQRTSQGISNGKLSVPDYTVTDTGYDFSAYPANTIKNPTTGVSYPNNFIPFSDIRLGSSEPTVGENVLNFYQQYATPNVAGATTSGNFLYVPQKTLTEDAFDVKVDHRFRDGDNGFLRYSQSRDNMVVPGLLPNPLVGGTIVGPAQDPAHQVVLSETHVFSPTLVNTARFGWSRLFVNATNFDRGLNLPTQLGINGVERGDPNSDGLPVFNFVGYTGIGDNGNNPTQIGTNNYQWDDDVNIVRGRHSINTGVEFVRLQYNMFQTAFEHGSLTFSGAFTGNPFTDLLFGAPLSGSYAFPYGTQGFRQSNLGVYVQDNYKATSRLTLNLGLRYENFLGWPWTEVNNKEYQFLPSLSTTELFQVGAKGIPRGGVKGRNLNFAPRVGLAYRLLEKTVVHAGYGIYYGAPNVTNSSFLGNNDPAIDYWAFTNGGKTYGASNFIPLSNGFTHQPATDPANLPIGTPAYAADPNAKTPYSEQWHLSLQQQITPTTTLTIGYVGTYGLHQDGLVDINVNPDTPDSTKLGLNRPYPQFGSILQLQTRQISKYNALQITGERRARNVSFLASYTYSHALDNSSGSPGSVSDPYSLRYDYGNADTDLRHRLVGSATYNLPFHAEGRSKYVVEGWQLNGIVQIFGGLPFSVLTAPPEAGTSNRAELVPGQPFSVSHPGIGEWFNTAAFAVPAAGTWGNSGRNILHGPGTKDVDFSVFKNFRLAESRSLQIRGEFFNLFNTAQFNNPANTVGPKNFGTLTSAGSPQTFQRVSREIQLAAKFTF